MEGGTVQAPRYVLSASLALPELVDCMSPSQIRLSEAHRHEVLNAVPRADDSGRESYADGWPKRNGAKTEDAGDMD